ncbi:MAG TPA: sigma-70 family RNA polymerase sigma factor, partial [Planctomycetota bacterium]|nr:sigma-70 family RNA polymerase sigma factor [Planctomycetota bacterium]
MGPRSNAAEAWEHLLAETEWLGRLAAQLVPPADRNDLVHDVLVVAAQHAQQPRSVRAWLTSVARNLATRRRLRARNRRCREAVVARAECDAVPVAEAVAAFATHRAVVNAVMALDEPYRTAVLLRFWEDLPVREVAKRTGVPAETARTHIKRGVERLRGALDRETGDRRAWTVPLLQIRAVRDAVLGAGPPPLAAIPFLAGALMSKGVVVAAAAAVSVLFAAWVVVGEAASEPAGEGAAPRGEAVSLAGPSAPAPAAPSAPFVRREVAATAARPGVHVEGHVVALDGSAVPRARIHALGSDPSADPVLLATAGDDGAFALRDVEPETRLQARAAGWQPSNGKARIAARRGDTVPIRIVMGARGHAL